jgi:hypothetical protein
VTINRDQIERARAEAQAFVAACDEALVSADAEVAQKHRVNGHLRSEVIGDLYDGKPKPDDRPQPKPSGALRRRSMDLTRSLADLRRH